MRHTAAIRILPLVTPTKQAVALIATGPPYPSHGCELNGVNMWGGGSHENARAMRRDDTSDMIMSEIIMRMAHDSDHSMDHKRSTQGSPLGLPWERSGRSTAADLPDLSGRRRTDSPMTTHSPMHTHSPHPAPADAYRVSTHRTLAEGDMRNNAKHVLNIGKSTALHYIPLPCSRLLVA